MQSMQSVTFTVWIWVSKPCSSDVEHHLGRKELLDMAFQLSAVLEVSVVFLSLMFRDYVQVEVMGEIGFY